MKWALPISLIPSLNSFSENFCSFNSSVYIEAFEPAVPSEYNAFPRSSRSCPSCSSWLKPLPWADLPEHPVSKSQTHLHLRFSITPVLLDSTTIEKHLISFILRSASPHEKVSMVRAESFSVLFTLCFLPTNRAWHLMFCSYLLTV